MLGGPVLSAIAGAESSSTTTPIRIAASAGRFSAAPTTTISRELPFGARPIRQRLMLGPTSTSRAGPTRVATATLSTTTIATVPASEASSGPGTTKIETSIEISSVLPAKIVVRPAVRRVMAAAVCGSFPAASSSRKRETISSA